MGSGKLRVDQIQPVSKGRGRNILVSAFFVFMLLAVCTGCRQKTDYQLFDIPDTLTLRTGDIAFRTGESMVSRSVTSVDTAGVYSHVGMVIWHDNQWCVLHAVPNERVTKTEKDSVKMEPIGVFFRSDRAVEGCICRLPLAPGDTLKLLKKGEEIYSRKLLFDKNFDDQDTTAFYCSELVWFLYQRALGIDLTRGRRHQLPLFPPLIFCSDIKSYPELYEIDKFSFAEKKVCKKERMY